MFVLAYLISPLEVTCVTYGQACFSGMLFSFDIEAIKGTLTLPQFQKEVTIFASSNHGAFWSLLLSTVDLDGIQNVWIS